MYFGDVIFVLVNSVLMTKILQFFAKINKTNRHGAYPRVKHLKAASLGYAPALLANIRLGWRGLPGTNTQAYNENPYITAVKCLIVQTPRVLMKLTTGKTSIA